MNFLTYVKKQDVVFDVLCISKCLKWFLFNWLVGQQSRPGLFDKTLYHLCKRYRLLDSYPPRQTFAVVKKVGKSHRFVNG